MPKNNNEKRWNILFFYWFCHALVGGSARVIFESNLPNIIHNTNEYRDFTQADVPILLSIGTLVTIVAKFSSGLFIGALGPYGIGVGSLFACGMIIMSCGIITSNNTPLLSIFLGWYLMRFFQSATWPAANVLFDAWFPTNEHGRAWGVMSTASRTGVMLVSFTIAYLSTSTTIQLNFLGCGIFLCLYGIILSFNLKNEPPPPTEEEDTGNDNKIEKKSSKKTEKKESIHNVGKKSFWNELFDCTIFEPTFYFAALVQASTTPIAEFQSQVPIWLSMDKTLTQTHVSIGVSAWHAGILCSVSIFGILFDKVKSYTHKGFLLAIPMLCNYILFSIVLSDFNVEDQIIVGPKMKIGVAFLLGFTLAPAFYLCMGTWTMKHATRRVMATSNSFVDVFGYGGSVLVLYLQQSKDSSNPMKELIRIFTYCSLLCSIALLILFVYFEEHYHKTTGKTKED